MTTRKMTSTANSKMFLRKSLAMTSNFSLETSMHRSEVREEEWSILSAHMELRVPIMIMENASSLSAIQMESVSAIHTSNTNSSIRKPGDLQEAEPTMKLTISASATDGDLLFVLSLLGEGRCRI